MSDYSGDKNENNNSLNKAQIDSLIKIKYKNSD
jgi:hypothetical protein